MMAEGYVHLPGRWKKEVREPADGANWYWLEFVGSEKELEFQAFRMASGGDANWRVARDESLQTKLLEILCKWLEAQDMGEKGLDQIVEGQPLRLRLLRRLLEAAGDPDREFSWEAEEGPPVNYSSVEEHVDFAKAKFEEDIAEGLMLKMSLRDFKGKCGEHRAIAALAVIVEDESVGKKRMIHDATHGVRVNHRICCRDKIRAPGAREKKQLLREMMEARQVAFSVVGGIAEAHRRFKQWVEEHGYLGCQIDASEEIPGDPESQTVYVNKVGTFGVSCAS